MGVKRKRERQARLTLTPLPSSSPASVGYNQQIRDRAAAVAYQGSPLRHKTLAPDNQQVSPLSNAANTFVPAIRSRHSPKSLGLSSPRQSRISGNGHGKRQKVLDFSNAPAPGSLEPIIDLTSSAVPDSSFSVGLFSSQPRPNRLGDLSGDETSSGSDLPSPVVPSTSLSKARTLRARKNLRVDDTLIGDDDDDDDDDDEIRSSVRGPGQRTVRASQRPILLDSGDDDDERERARDANSPSTTSSPPRSKEDLGKNSDDGIDEPDALSTPKQRVKLKGRKMTSEEKADLDEDLEFLQPSSDSEHAFRQPQSTQSVQKNARLQALERLKRKRAGKPDPVVSDTDMVQRPYEDAALDQLSENDQEDVLTEMVPTSSRQYFTQTREDEEFIISEDEGILGVQNSMPIEFTHYARMKPKELFKYAVEWMVQKKINPAFARNDELYDLTFKKLNDEITGLAGSKFTSSAWTPQFTLALKARPEIEVYHMRDGGGGCDWLHDKCDACNRSGHPASYEVKFSGTPYHTATLEEIGEEDDDNDTDTDTDSADGHSSGASHAAYDAQGRQIAPADTIYYVGRHCTENAQTAHKLQHWRYHLYDWVTTWLTRNGHDAPEAVVRRDKMSMRKRRKHANRIVDSMVEQGVVKKLWHDFKSNIDEARGARQGGRFGGDSSP